MHTQGNIYIFITYHYPMNMFCSSLVRQCLWAGTKKAMTPIGSNITNVLGFSNKRHNSTANLVQQPDAVTPVDNAASPSHVHTASCFHDEYEYVRDIRRTRASIQVPKPPKRTAKYLSTLQERVDKIQVSYPFVYKIRFAIRTHSRVQYGP